jgi:predicted ATPase
MHAGMVGANKINMKMIRPLHLGYAASAHAEADENEIAFSLFEEAIGVVEQTEEREFEAELHRMRGELLVRKGRIDEAEAALTRALSISRRQQARMWELRAAASLARLRRDQGRYAEARDLLAPIYGWFTEGFETPDLRQAKALLDEMK